MKTTKWITMAAVVTLTASLAFAAPHGGGHGGKRGRHGHEFGERMAAKLNLTDAQKQQIRDMQQSFRDKNKAVFENAAALRDDFREAKKAGDTAKLESLKPAMEAQREQMKQLRDAQRQQILTVLTPEQRTQWEALKAEREQRRGERGRGRDRK
ncbi:MAG TPA: Spy/CpxP family protein refolding chaperone [Thermoanaerobaculia bacterium]|jgi:protein CpxP|nr:Spy/CpxP family protein refolding chaperone [Thermoanaerobaculia bacterium]